MISRLPPSTLQEMHRCVMLSIQATPDAVISVRNIKPLLSRGALGYMAGFHCDVMRHACEFKPRNLLARTQLTGKPHQNNTPSTGMVKSSSQAVRAQVSRYIDLRGWKWAWGTRPIANATHRGCNNNHKLTNTIDKERTIQRHQTSSEENDNP